MITMRSPQVARSVFAATYDLPDWRIVSRTLQAEFRAKSLASAAAFAQQVVDAADAADHHPDIALRASGRIRIVLSSHDANGLSARDASLAATVSGLARTAGLAAEPLVVQRLEVAIDVMNIAAVMPFWKAVLAYVEEPPQDSQWPSDALIDPLGVGQPLWFQQMDTPRPDRNRIHLDVLVPEDVALARVDAALAAGGTLLTDQYARSFWVLADPEGNEICVCTWQDRD